MKKKHAGLLSLAVFFCIPTTGQEIQGNFVVITYTERDGLPTSLRELSYRDHLGRIWVSTTQGLSRFDGTTFHNYNTKDGLPAEALTTMTEDGKGHIMAANYKGIYLYDPSGPQTFRQLTNLSSDVDADYSRRMYALAARDTNDLYYGYFDDREYRLYHWYHSRSSLVISKPKKLLFVLGISGDTVLASTEDEMLQIRGNRVTGKLPIRGFSVIDRFMQTPYGLWYKGARLYKINADKIVDSLHNMANLTAFYQAAMTGPGSYMATPTEGKYQLFDYREGKLNSLDCGGNPEKVISTPTGLYKDKDGTIWITKFSGLYRLQHLPYTRMQADDFHLRFDGQDRLAAVCNTLFNKRKDIAADRKLLKSKNATVLQQYEDSDIIWYQHQYGIAWRVKGKKNMQLLDTFNLFCMAKDGDVRWFCTSNSTLRYEHGRFKEIPQGPTAYAARSAETDRQHRLWITRVEGLYVVDSIQKKISKGFPSDQNFSTIAKDSSGNLWMAGTSHHIYLVQPAGDGICLADSVASPFTGQQQPAKSMVFDKSGNLWVCYANGIVVYFFSRGRPIPGKYIYLTPDNGFAPITEARKLFLMADGNIAIPLNQSLFVLHVGEILQNYHTTAPVPFIDRIWVNNKPFDWYAMGYLPDSSGLPFNPKLSNNYHSVSFFFSSIGFYNARYYRYRYRLVGLNDDWLETAPLNLTAIYSGLHPGSYTFQLMVANENGIWSAPISYPFSILPPWYLTWWAIVLWFVLGIGLIVCLLQLRQRAVIRRLRYEQMLTEQRLLALRAQINPHALQNTFSFLAERVRKDYSEAVVETIHKVSKYFRELLYKSDQTIVALEDEMIFNEEYLEMQCMLHRGRFSYTVEIADDVDTFGLHVPSMLLQPVLENAIRYSTANPDGGRIAVQVKQGSHYVIIQVCDNGVTHTQPRVPGHKSKGLEITRHKLSLVYARCKYAPQLYIRPNKNKEGHTVEIALPLL